MNYQFSSVTQSCPNLCNPMNRSQSSFRLTSIESVMPSSHLILCHPLLLLLPIPPSIKVFSNESTLHFRWPHTQNSVVQFTATTTCNGASLVAQRLKHLPPRKETWVRSLGREDPLENGNPLQYSCLENSKDREAWRTTVHGVAKSQTRLSD